MSPKVSVTIPVYNTAKYLRQCLDSLAAQTLGDIEFIIVDDGSTDGSGEICDSYAAKDPRFRVIHQPNGGSSVARETGLRNAKGDYVIVCDSDDWTEPEMYEMLYKKAVETDADIVTCGYFSEYDNGKQSTAYQRYNENDGVIDNTDMLLRGAGWSWVKLMRRKLFEQGNIHYEPGVNLSEDSLLIYKIMKLHPKIVQIDKPLYHYRRIIGGTSYTNSLSMKHIHQLEFTYNWLKGNYSGKEWEGLVRKRAVDLAFACLRTKDLDKKFFRNFIRQEIPPLSTLFGSDSNLKLYFIQSSKILPVRLLKTTVKLLYPFFYT